MSIRKLTTAASLALLVAATASAAQFPYETDFSQYDAGAVIAGKAGGGDRGALFPDAKPAKGEFQPVGKKYPEVLQVTASDETAMTGDRAMKFSVDAAAAKAAELDAVNGSIRLTTLKCPKDFRIETSVYLDDLYKGRKEKNYFFMYLGGCSLWFRGDRGDLRVYDVSKKKYDRFITAQNKRWYKIVIDMHYDPANPDNGTFDLLVEGEKSIEGLKLRGAPIRYKDSRFTYNCQTIDDALPTVYIDQFKITPIEK